MAVPCSALAALPGHLRTKLCVLSISFGFCSEKEAPLPLFLHFRALTARAHLARHSVSHDRTGYFTRELATIRCDDALHYDLPPRLEGKRLLLLVTYWGSYKLRLNAGISTIIQKVHKGVSFYIG